MTGEDIYNLFKQELDGEEFDSDDDALRVMNIVYRKILADRDWHILKKYATLTTPTLSLAGITDLDKVLKVWAVGDGGSTDRTPLKKARFDQRFDESFDYWINYPSNALALIGDNNSYAGKDKVVDYKYKPADLAMDTEPIFPVVGQPAIAYEMILVYKEKDENPDFYTQIEKKRDVAVAQLIAWNESLEEYA